MAMSVGLFDLGGPGPALDPEEHDARPHLDAAGELAALRRHGVSRCLLAWSASGSCERDLSPGARRRFHTDRIIGKRAGQARSLRWLDDRELFRGRLDDEQWYLGCHGARCGVCHPVERWSSGDRQREDREWHRNEERAWAAPSDGLVPH